MPVAGLHGWLGGIPQQHQAGVSRQSQTNSGTWACLVTGLVGLAHRDSDQTHGEQASHGGCASDESWVFRASHASLTALSRGIHAQYVLHRTLEWARERTAGDINAQMSSCRSAAPGP